MRSSIQLLVVIAAFGTDAVARAQDETQGQDWPRFHIGAAYGEPDLVWDWSQSGLPERFWSDESMEPERARKVVAGFRPVRIVGVEIQYIDFDDTGLGARGTLLRGGSRQGGPAVYDQASFMKAGAEAWLLSALLFIPEQLPLVDVYGKVGVADLAESFTAIATTVECVPLSQCTNRIYSDVHESNVGPYIGIGARFELAPAVAVRAEYEAIDRDVGDPAAMLSLGFAWEH